MSNPILAGSLRLLNAFAGSELAEKYGLTEPAKRWVATGTQKGAEWLRKMAARAKAKGIEPDDGTPRRRFDLTPTESQALIQQTMRRFAEDALRPSADAADVALAPPAALLSGAADLGLLELAVPEAYGGAAEERSVVTWTLAAEELARGDMGLALALLAPVSCAHLVVDLGTDAQKKAWLGTLLSGGFVAAAPAMLEAGPLFDPRALRTTAREKRGGWQLRGEKALVPLGESARFFVVSAAVKDRGRQLFVVERERVTVTPAPAMGLRSAGLCTVSFDVELPAEARLGGDAEPVKGAGAQRAVDLARIGWGALAVGQGQAMLEYVTTYCNDRVAFGEPITNRQAVAFMIADIAIELEGLRLLTWRAAARAERGERFTRQAHLVKAQANEVAMKIGTDGVQLLGGAGFIREHPVERWYRHLRAVAVMEGAVTP